MRKKWARYPNLRGGVGFVDVHMVQIFNVAFVTFKLGPRATIGSHQHLYEREVYFTFNKAVRFSGTQRFFNFCRKGKAHSAENLSWKEARMWAVKF